MNLECSVFLQNYLQNKNFDKQWHFCCNVENGMSHYLYYFLTARLVYKISSSVDPNTKALGHLAQCCDGSVCVLLHTRTCEGSLQEIKNSFFSFIKKVLHHRLGNSLL